MMNRVFAENGNRDIYIGPNKQIAVLSGVSAVEQSAKAAMEIQLGEAIYSRLRGVPNLEAVWAGTPNIPQFEFYARRQILAVSGVTGIESLATSVDGEILSYNVTIATIYGQGLINGSV